jgi:Lar family restriction alleviation protein
MSSTKIEILPCPFCRQESFSLEDLSDVDDNDGLFCVTCNECGAAGPQSLNEIIAVQLWNSAVRNKASLVINGDSLFEVFNRFSQIVFAAMPKEDKE